MQQYSDPDDEALKLGISSANWSLFGVVWDSSQVLARLMVDYEIDGKRILELGCGIALSSLLLNRRGGDITATDYHPEAESYLQKNTRLNQDPDIPFFRADWDDAESRNGGFDLIVGSDVLYEQTKLSPLAGFIEGHARPTCEVVIVDPGRKLQGQFSRLMAQRGYSREEQKPEDVSGLKKTFSGSILTYRK